MGEGIGKHKSKPHMYIPDILSCVLKMTEYTSQQSKIESIKRWTTRFPIALVAKLAQINLLASKLPAVIASLVLFLKAIHLH